jgi:hypothetical protein
MEQAMKMRHIILALSVLAFPTQIRAEPAEGPISPANEVGEKPTSLFSDYLAANCMKIQQIEKNELNGWSIP